MSKKTKKQDSFLTQFVPATRKGRATKFVLSEMMPKNPIEILIIPISEGSDDKRKGKMAIATLYSLVRDSGVFILFGTNTKTHKKEVALVREIPEDLKDLSWRLIIKKK